MGQNLFDKDAHILGAIVGGAGSHVDHDGQAGARGGVEDGGKTANLTGVAKIDARVGQMQLQSLCKRLAFPRFDFGQSLGRQRIDRDEGDQPLGMRGRRGHGEGVGGMNAVGRVGQGWNHHRALGQIGRGHDPSRLDARLVHIRQKISGRQWFDEGRIAGADPPRTVAIGRQNLPNGRGVDMDMMVGTNQRTGPGRGGRRSEHDQGRARRDKAFEEHGA